MAGSSRRGLMQVRPLPSSSDNPALFAFKLATGAGLVYLLLTNARAVGAAINALLSIVSNMFAVVTGGGRGPAGGGLGPGVK